MNATINVTELADTLATKDLYENWKDEFGGCVESMYETQENGDRTLVEKAQDLYNELHDHWESIIMESECKNSISIQWSIDDVRSCNERWSKLTDNECRDVLESVERNFDANNGINWDVIDITAEILFGGE